MRTPVVGWSVGAQAARLVAVAVLSVFLLACPDPGPTTGGADGSGSGADEVVAYVHGEPIRLGEVETAGRNSLQQVDRERFEVLRVTLNDMINERLIARAAETRGLTPREFLVQEVAEKVPDPTEEELRAAYDEVRSRLGDRSFDDVRSEILQGMRNQRRRSRQVNLLREMRAEAGLQMLLEPPRSFVPVRPDENIRGGADAPLTIVGYGHFQSRPYRQMHPVVLRILEEFGDKVRYVFRDFPDSEQRRSVPAALAAWCARDQGQYWPYHDHLLTVPGDLGDEDLIARATEMGMIVEAFKICLESQSHGGAVREAFESGRVLGVTAIPTYFVNGRMIVGAQDYEDFKELVELELARAASND